MKYSVISGRLIVERIVDPIELFKKPPKVIISWDEFKMDQLTLSLGLEEFKF